MGERFFGYKIIFYFFKLIVFLTVLFVFGVSFIGAYVNFYCLTKLLSINNMSYIKRERSYRYFSQSILVLLQYFFD